MTDGPVPPDPPPPPPPTKNPGSAHGLYIKMVL